MFFVCEMNSIGFIWKISWNMFLDGGIVRGYGIVMG
jgi:hypothetical protein